MALDFETLFQGMVQHLALNAEAKDGDGNLKYADLCEFFCAEYPEAADRARFAAELQELDRKCCYILGAEICADTVTETVPAPPGAPRLVGQSLPVHRVRLWQLGFAEESAVRGVALGHKTSYC